MRNFGLFVFFVYFSLNKANPSALFYSFVVTDFCISDVACFVVTPLFFSSQRMMEFCGDGMATSLNTAAAIVLGCTVMPDGSPSDWLKDRLSATMHLVHFFQRKLLAARPTPNTANAAPVDFTLHVVCTGGAVRSAVSEASCMRQWLASQLQQQRSETTEEGGLMDLSFSPIAQPPSDGSYVCVSEHDGGPPRRPLSCDVHSLRWTSSSVTPSKESSARAFVSCFTIHIVEEASATDTVENMRYSVQYLIERGLLCVADRNSNPDARKSCVRELWLVTSDFHLVRGATLLRNTLLPFPTTYMLQNEKVLPSGEGDEPSIAQALARRGPDLQDDASSFLVQCLGAPTPTLQGDRLLARREREQMLLPQDIKLQAATSLVTSQRSRSPTARCDPVAPLVLMQAN